jgi:hypothetical protein
VGDDSVTYRGFYSRWKIISVPKSQHTTVKCDQPVSKRASTLSDVPHKSPTGPLLVISQHELTFLQSESPNTDARPASTFFGHKLLFLKSGSFQTHVLLSQFPNTNSVFQPTGVRSQTHACLHSAISNHGLTTNQYKSVYNNLVTIETYPCLLSRA